MFWRMIAVGAVFSPPARRDLVLCQHGICAVITGVRTGRALRKQGRGPFVVVRPPFLADSFKP